VLFSADFALGVRILISASNGHCAYKGGSNCSAHIVLGAVIIAASVMDYMFALVFVHCIEQICTRLDTVTCKVRHAIYIRLNEPINRHASCLASEWWPMLQALILQVA
jgi:hypothetical protein